VKTRLSLICHRLIRRDFPRCKFLKPSAKNISSFFWAKSFTPSARKQSLLGLPFAAPSRATANDAETLVLLLKTTDAPCGLLVDEIVKPQEIVIKPLDGVLRNLKRFLGAFWATAASCR
jgi:chemotaxis protein histidine kinase CheA